LYRYSTAEEMYVCMHRARAADDLYVEAAEGERRKRLAMEVVERRDRRNSSSAPRDAKSAGGDDERKGEKINDARDGPAAVTKAKSEKSKKKIKGQKSKTNAVICI
jgi:hypothetical protein